MKAKRVDEGEALKCLIEHKNDDEMEAKCQASIEHFQLVSILLDEWVINEAKDQGGVSQRSQVKLNSKLDLKIMENHL